MKILLWTFLAFFGGSQLQAQVDNSTEARVKNWLMEKRTAFYADRAKDPAVQTFLRQYDQLEKAGIFCTPTSSPQLLKLKAQRTSEDLVKVDWQAETDQNVVGYRLERSDKKDGHYVQLQYIQSAGSSANAQDYHFLDNNSSEGKSYYRVVQVLASGKKQESEAVADGYETIISLKAYPNPSVSRFHLSIQSKRKEPLQLKVIDAVGRVVEQKENLAANQVFEIGALYRPGIYVVQVVQANKTKQIKLEKRSSN